MDESILYGYDNEENIVAVENKKDQNICQIFKRVDGELVSRYEPYYYLVYTTKDEPLLDKYEVDTIPLFGSNHYNVLVKTKDRSIYLDFKYNARDCEVPYDQSQYMLQTGKTCFKGMDIDDPLVMYFDLETYTAKGYDFSNASRESDKIIMIAVRTNRGYEEVLRLDEHDDEKDLLNHFIALTRKIDPDIIANHNIFNFDLKYLDDRCELLGVKLGLGRDGSEPTSFETSIKFADRSRSYINYSIYGRQIIDTQFLAEYADVTNRDMPSYRLKDLVKYLDKAEDDRVYIPGEDIASIWDGENPIFDRDDLAKYAIHDVREAEILFKEYSGASFSLTQMVPMNFQEVFRYGTGNQVEYVFWREYYRQNWSYPKHEEEGKVPGGYADVLSWGIFKEKIVYVDVKSLYPSLASMLEIQPKKDELKIFQKILKILTQIKYDIDKKEEAAKYAMIKIFLNTMAYGFIASPWNAFADYKEASRITLTGQEVMKDMIKVIQDQGGTVIKVDTDGAAITLPEKYKDNADEYCKVLTDHTPEGIIIENDGEFNGIIPFGGKSYALLEEDGEIKFKGNKLIGRSIEGFGTKFIKACVEHLFEEEDKRCWEEYKYWKNRIKQRELEPDEVSVRKNINMKLDEYQHKNQSGNTQTLAQYELAIQADKKYSKGDVITFYIKEFPYESTTYYGKPVLKKKKCKQFEAAELIENYNYDIEPEHYLDRLDTLTCIFMVLGEEKFYELFDIKVYSAEKRKFENLTDREWNDEIRESDRGARKKAS